LPANNKSLNNSQALQVANNFDFLGSHHEVRLSFTFNGERRAFPSFRLRSFVAVRYTDVSLRIIRCRLI